MYSLFPDKSDECLDPELSDWEAPKQGTRRLTVCRSQQKYSALAGPSAEACNFPELLIAGACGTSSAPVPLALALGRCASACAVEISDGRRH